MASATSLKAFQQWDENAKAGSSFAYWNNRSKGGRPAKPFEYARGLNELGDTLLVQRREANNSLSYVAVRISTRAAAFVKRFPRMFR